MPNPLERDLNHILAHTADVWTQLRGARVFVTGGTGFFGCWMLESFVWACDALHLDTTMTVLTRSPEAFHVKAPHLAGHPAIGLWRGDVRSFEFPGERFTHVIHGATEASAALNREQPLLMLDTIVDGTRRTLDFAVTAGVKRFLLLSSGLVYGTQPASLSHVPESYSGGPDTTDPRLVYAEGKRLSELLGTLYSRQTGLECPIARGFAFRGAIPAARSPLRDRQFHLRIACGRPIRILGDGTPRRSYLYAADLAIWLWTMLVRGQSGRVFNVGSEEASASRNWPDGW